MATVSVKVCDTCKDVTRATRRWAMQSPDGSRLTVDLCDEHSVVLTGFMEEHKSSVRKPSRRSTGHHSNRKITSIEEIEASKRKK